MGRFLLVVEDDIRSPDLLEGQPDVLDIPKVRIVPGEVGVVPHLER